MRGAGFSTAAALLLGAVSAYPAEAGFILAGNTFAFDAGGPATQQDGHISFAVYEATAGPEFVSFASGSVALNDGEFGYFYQIANTGSGPDPTQFFTVAASNVNSVGRLNGTILSDGDGMLSTGVSGNRGLGTDSSLADPFHDDAVLNSISSATGTTVDPAAFGVISSTEVQFRFLPPPATAQSIASGALSSLLYFTSNTAPGIGSGLLMPPDAPGNLPVPTVPPGIATPVPPIFGLVGAGIPFLSLLRRKRR